ncbi:MAG: branched-chain amino acid aminotransferase [Eubacteriales bacterium]|nr:branched-chain amino acid aminotransferase [Eubacteriales bacterium]
MKKISWNELEFKYMKTDKRFVSRWKNGQWDQGRLKSDNHITLSEASTALHYGQQCFEGLKAYRTRHNRIQLFRPEENAKRMQESCRRLLMPELSVEKFIRACELVVRANEYYVPPYGTNSALYLRPFMIGVGNIMGVKPADEYLFCVYCSPVGPYFKGGLKPVEFVTSDFDRAAPMGTGGVKVGGNYASSLYPNHLAKKQGYADCIYLDPKTHTKIEEVGAANFFGITHDETFVTPESYSILPSITKQSLLYLAEHYMHLKTQQRDVCVDKLNEFKEAGACGTAAVITPIGSITHKGKKHVFYSEDKVGPMTMTLFNTLTNIQFGDLEAPKDWIYRFD